MKWASTFSTLLLDSFNQDAFLIDNTVDLVLPSLLVVMVHLKAKIYDYSKIFSHFYIL